MGVYIWQYFKISFFKKCKNTIHLKIIPYNSFYKNTKKNIFFIWKYFLYISYGVKFKFRKKKQRLLLLRTIEKLSLQNNFSLKIRTVSLVNSSCFSNTKIIPSDFNNMKYFMKDKLGRNVTIEKKIVIF